MQRTARRAIEHHSDLPPIPPRSFPSLANSSRPVPSAGVSVHHRMAAK
jgi:hypothetical protein